MKFNLKENKVTNWFYLKRTYFFAFLIPVAIMFAAYAAFGCYPFGDNSALVLDLNGQYVYYYEALRDAFWGDGSIFMSWSRNLTGEMMGIFGYYLASPFNIIMCLLPRSMMLEGVLIMQLAKIGACAVTFAFYLKNSRRISGYTILIFSTLYSLMSYAVVQLMNPMWLDGLVFLPLIAYGVEKLVDEKKKLRYIIPLAIMFVANFYIGWMIGFFTLIYFLVYYFFGKKDEEYVRSETLKTFGRFAFSTIVAILCAAAILIPVYYSLKLGKLEFSSPTFDLLPKFAISDFFTKLLPESYDTVRPEGLPFVYCGVLTLFMVPLYFLNSNIEKRKKIGTAVLLVAVFASMYLSTIDLAWHGFQVPNWLNYRYSFTFCFVMLIAAAEAFERIEGVTLKQIGITLAILLVYVVYVDSLKLKHLPTTGAIWFSILCIVGFGILLFYYKNHATVKTAPLVLLILVVGELFGSTFDTLKAIDKDVTYSKHSSYVNYIEDGRELISDLEKIDGGLYRTEKTFHRTVNDPMAWGFKGISHSSSTLNAEAIQLIKRLGFTCGGHSIKYKGGTFASDAILGIKYVINKDEDIYYEKEVLKKDDMTVYENPYALPLAFLVDNGIKDVQMSSSNPFINQNSILNGMTAEPYTDYFTEMEIANKNLENVTEGNSGDHRKYAPVDKDTVAQVEYLVDVPTDNISYMYLDTTYRRDVNYWVNNRFLDADKDNSNIHALGRFDAGDTISFITTLDADDLLVKNMWFYQLDEEKLAETVEELKKSPLEIEEFTDTHIKGTVTAAENQTLFTTITDEPGWTIKIDGKKVEPVKLLNATIGVDVPVGTHVITMDFFPKGLKIGLILSGIGIILVIFIGIFEYKRRKVLLKRLYN